ncbi:hypothetical protein [Rhodococcus kronopolitis]|uniref:Toxin-antitoxin system HicB family antitoxin n=1 Tax=Rhodococcus kronopolitis TaxID=1460226 RepID=A0ABV9FJB8_9NOCA
MDLTPYVDSLRNELAQAAEFAGPEARALAERLIAPLESAVRLTLLDALSAAASEITRDLAPGSVELRLQGREPTFVVTPPPAEARPVRAESPEIGATYRTSSDAEEMTRINLRLNQELKERVEAAARDFGLSANAWLVRSAAAALSDAGRRIDASGPRAGQSVNGWVR